MPALKELGVEKDIEFMRIVPLDRTYFCGMDIITSTNVEDYIRSLQNNFPRYKGSTSNTKGSGVPDALPSGIETAKQIFNQSYH